MRRWLMSSVLIFGCFGVSVVSANTQEQLGRDNLYEEEQKINVESYNPTEPEIQLGDVKYITIDESGAVGIDSEVVQGFLNGNKDVVVEAVKGEGRVYYVLEKGGYVISLWGDNGKIIADDGSTVKVKEVDSLYGHNGLAIDRMFQSNIVPQGFLPKTGVGDIKAEEDTQKIAFEIEGGNFRNITFGVLLSALFLFMMIVVYARIGDKREKIKQQVDVEDANSQEEKTFEKEDEQEK